MSRIHKALEKAREKRQQQKLASGKASPLEKIVYTDSQVIPVCHTQLEKNRVVSRSAHDPRSQLFRTLRTTILKQMRAHNWRSIGITSPCPGEGKSLVASNLAAAIAMEVNYTALLVDMDLRNPGITNYFDVEPKQGLADYLQGNAEIGDLLVNPGVERLLLLPGRGKLDNSSELISSPRMVALFNEVTERYKSRIVVYDMPAILPRDDVLAALNHVDCFLMVIEEGRNSEVDIRKAIQSMQNASIVGTVVNKSQTAESGYMPTMA